MTERKTVTQMSLRTDTSFNMSKSKIQPGNSSFEQVFSLKKIKVYIILFRYLEGTHLIGPSLEIFKIAMLSTKMFKFVT